MDNLKKRKRRLVTMVLALILVLVTVMPTNISVQASDGDTVNIAAVATPGDADGIYKAEDGYYYYFVGAQIVSETGWITVDKNLSVSLDSKYRVQFKDEKKGDLDYISKFDSKKNDFVKFTKDVIELADKKLYYSDANGEIVTKAGSVYDGSGTTYFLGNRGVVTSKFEKNGEARRYYIYSDGKWDIVKNAYKTIDGKVFYFSAGSGIATMMYVNSTQHLYKYQSSKMVLVKNSASTVRDSRIFLFGNSGQRITKSGWYKLASGSKVYVCAKGYITAKITVSGKSNRYYTYDYRSLKWAAKKNTWINLSGTDYYFAPNGVAAYAYNTRTGKFSVYKNGKWNSVKNAIYKLRNGGIYFANSKSIVTKTSGWYSISSTDKVYVGPKGYVTMRFSTKSGKLTKYNYGKKKWELIKVTEYKIGSKTYYFNSNGILAKSEIVGNAKTGYFYVDETGCKVTSQEIQMAVNFVVKNTNSGMNREQKLRACYNKLSTFPYQRDYTKPSYEGRFRELAIEALSNGTANCYRYASAFACVATVLGYNARVTCGLIPPWYNGELTMHGWTELWDPSLKQWRVYDPCKQRNAVNESYYNRDISTFYPGSLQIERRVQLTVKNGQDSWSWIN